jgi:NAD(P)H-dependent FMN reductase
MEFLPVCGSLRAASTNRALLEALARHAPDGIAVSACAETGALPLFNPDIEGTATPPTVSAFARAVGKADGLIIAVPEYAHGIPGNLKNALDWLVSRFEIPGKPVMLVHASTRGVFVREHLSEVLRTMSARLYPGPAFEVHLVGKSPAEAAAILDEPVHVERIRSAMEGLVAFVRS